MSPNIGQIGEDIAATYLKNRKYRICTRNYFVRYAEVDIIADDNGTLVFIEVKTRVGSLYGKPYDAVSQKKIKKIYMAGLLYSSGRKIAAPMRIDVISIELESNFHLKSLFHMRNIEV